MIILFSKEEEKTVKKKKKKGNLYAKRRKKQGCSARIKLKQFKINWRVFRQNTCPGLVFFGSRAAKLTFLFRFADMDYQIKKQGCWRSEVEPTLLLLSRDLKPEEPGGFVSQGRNNLIFRENLYIQNYLNLFKSSQSYLKAFDSIRNYSGVFKTTDIVALFICL
jgi:hypothetical protein